MSVAHLNTSSFDEFSYMMHKYNFDFVVLSGTWLKNDQTQLQYVQIDDYKSELRNRESKCGVRVCFYIKKLMSFNTRLDFVQTFQSIKIL